jgi:AcrR family transcriptional regulator
MSDTAAGAAERTRRRPADRRRQILDEATRIVGRRGYYGFSVQELADSCGLTVAGVLHHVGTKEKLLIALLEDRDRRDAEAITGHDWADAEDRGIVVTVAEALEVLHNLVVRNSTQPELVRLHVVLRSEALDRQHPAYDYFRTREARVIAALARMIERLGGTDEPRSVARQLVATMAGLEEQWLRFPDEFELVAEWDRAMAKILRPD